MAKILIADDSDTDLAYLLEILSDLPHQVVSVRDGAQVEEKVKNERFDLFILDVIMPGKNGFQVCRGLKKHPATAAVPVILTTSKSADSDKFWGQKQGADVYLCKPYTPEQLLAAVNTFLSC
ncbi:MAG TPA: response regulator [Malonomonas sp.]